MATKQKKLAAKRKQRRNIPTKQAIEAAAKANKGNAFWELRSKHGRDLLFATPKLMWEAACEYFKWCDENPFYESKPMAVSMGMNSGSEVEMVEVPRKRPYTIQDLCRYLNCNTAYLRQFKDSKAYKENEGFSTVIADIEEVIYSQQFSGASSGFFNANIISRALGLVDKTDHTTAGEKIEAPVFQVLRESPALSSDEKKVDQKRKKRE